MRNQEKKNLSLSSLIFQGEQIYENKNDKKIINFESDNYEKKISKRCLALSRKSKANDNDNDNNNNTKSRVAKDIRNKVKLKKHSKPDKLRKDIKIKKDKSHDIDKPRQKRINKKYLTKSTKASAINNNDDDDSENSIKKKPKKPKLPEYRCTCLQSCDDDTNENEDLNKKKNPPGFGPSILKMAKNISSSSSRSSVDHDKSFPSVLLSCPVNATYLDRDGQPLPREQNVKNRSKCRFVMVPCGSPYYNSIQNVLKPQNNENLSTTTTPSTSTTLHANYPPNFPAYYPPNYPQNYPPSNYQQQNPQQSHPHPPPPPSSSTTPASFYIIGKSPHNKNYQHDQSYLQQENNNEESITTSINQDDDYSKNIEIDENNEDSDEKHQEASAENYSEEIKNYHHINNNNIINTFEQIRKNKNNKRVEPEIIGNEHLNELKDLTGLNHQDVILLRSSIYQAIYKLSTSIVDNDESKCDKVKTREPESVQGLGDLPIIQELFNIPAIKSMLINTVKNIIVKLTGVSKCSALGKLTNNKISQAIKIVIGDENLPELPEKSQWSLTNDNSRNSISEIIVEYLKKINEGINSKDSSFIKPGIRNIIFNFLINLIYQTKNVVENALKWKELNNDFNEDNDDKSYFLESSEKSLPIKYYSSEDEQLECKKKYRSIDSPINDGDEKKQLDELNHSVEEEKINSKTDESNEDVKIIPDDDFATKYQLSLNFQSENEDDNKPHGSSTSFDNCLDDKHNEYIKNLLKIHGVPNGLLRTDNKKQLKRQDEMNNPLINHIKNTAEKRLYKNIMKYKKKCDNLIDERKNMIEKILKWLKKIAINSNNKK